MPTVFDASADILHRTGPITHMKLQKLVYYAQAWSLVWDERPLFQERIEAWANGPVCPELYQAHQGEFIVDAEPNGDRSNLSKAARDTISAVLKTYGKKTAPWLSELTHRERPWKDARRGIADGMRSNRPISHAAMAEYYGNL